MNVNHEQGSYWIGHTTPFSNLLPKPPSAQLIYASLSSRQIW
jgi:hypothetical protein